MRVHSTACYEQHQLVAEQFPDNPFLARLIQRTEELGICFAPSPIPEQWLYHPEQRVIYVWEPDLSEQSLSYLVVILAHEIGHAVDFDLDPSRLEATRGLHWEDVPTEVEVAAFVEGFRILQELWIPINLDQYEQMIEPQIAHLVRKELEGDLQINAG